MSERSGVGTPATPSKYLQDLSPFHRISSAKKKGKYSAQLVSHNENVIKWKGSSRNREELHQKKLRNKFRAVESEEDLPIQLISSDERSYYYCTECLEKCYSIKGQVDLVICTGCIRLVYETYVTRGIKHNVCSRKE
jgi:hypothetical protein